MSNHTARDRWPIHGGDAATYQLTPPAGYEVATDWRLQFRAAPLPFQGIVLVPDVDETQLSDDPPIVQFDFEVGIVGSQHDGFEGDIQCSLGTLMTITLRVEDDWTQ